MSLRFKTPNTPSSPVVGLSQLIDHPTDVPWTIVLVDRAKGMTVLGWNGKLTVLDYHDSHIPGEKLMHPEPMVGTTGVSRSSNPGLVTK
jgi:hypothetical protein